MSYDKNIALLLSGEIEDAIKKNLASTSSDGNIARIACYERITSIFNSYGIESSLLKSKFVYSYFLIKFDKGIDIDYYVNHPGISVNKAIVLLRAVDDDIRFYNILNDLTEEYILSTTAERLALLSMSKGSNQKYGSVIGTGFEDLFEMSEMPWIYSISAGINPIYPSPEVITSHVMWPHIRKVYSVAIEKSLAIWFSSLSPETLLAPITSADRIHHYIAEFKFADTVEMGAERAIVVNEIFNAMFNEMFAHSPVNQIDSDDPLYKKNYTGIDRASTIDNILMSYVKEVSTYGSNILSNFD